MVFTKAATNNYFDKYDCKLNVFCAEDAQVCVTAPDRASLYTNALT